MSKSKIPYIVCLDPDSGQIYSMSLTNFDVHTEKNLPAKIKEKAKTTMKQLSFLRDSFSTKWWFKSHESECFRRRKLPSYLIQQDCLRYPTYEAHSKLSLAFSDIQTIEVEVDISEYHDSIVLLGQEVMEKHKMKAGERTLELTESQISESKSWFADNQADVTISDLDDYDPKEIPMTVIINASILTGASEVIKNILSLILQNYGIRLKPSNELYGFVLKISGFREYLIGESPLLGYDRIREMLRGLKTLKVNLTEISQLLISENFPMIVERETKNLEKGIYDPVDWKKYDDTPLLLWYSPIPLMDIKQATDLADELEGAYFQKFKKIDVLEADYTQPDFSLKQKIDYSKDNLHQMKSNCIYTAEVDLPFKVRICAVENLQAILTQYDEGATYNGFNTPSYITRQLIKKDEHGAHGKKKKETKKKDGIVITKFGKQKNDEFSGSVQHGDHGSNGQLYNNLYKEGEFTILPYMITVNASIYHGCNLLRKQTIASSKPVPFSFEPRWYEWLKFDNILVSELPRESKLCFDITIHSPSGESQVIAATCHQVFDLYNKMSDGIIHLNLWPFYTIESRFVCQQEFWFLTGKGMPPKESEADIFRSTEFARLVLQFQTYTAPVFWSLRDSASYTSLKPDIDNILKKIPSSQDLATVQHLITRDSLSWDFNEFERVVLIMCRHHYKTIPAALPVFLSAIDWSNPNEVAEAYQMLKIWAPLSPEEAVYLLDARFGDSEVRLYAVDRISNFSDDDLNLYLLELVQALDYEPQHYSALGEFLLERSLANPYKIGHELYWLLRSQLHIKPSYERISLILEQFLMLCGNFRQELQDEIIVNDMVTEIAEEVPRMDKGSRLAKAREKISGLKQHGLPSEFSVSLDTRMRGSELIAEECKVMDSKKLPLWLTVKNSQQGARSIKIIFKTGDDLKQDQLTLQLIRIMDKIWLDYGLDLRMKPYRVLSTADQAGMLEVVLDSETTSDIHKKYGGGALGAFNKKSIMNYIETWNQDQYDLANAKENFIRSCAGYAVATYCLGIGDRHSGNIMLTRSGHLFHIDFGHFLGNFKSKFERTAFVFTQEMAFVMGGRGSEDFEKFQDYCTKAYNLIRKNGNHFINLFIMMIVSGMPELASYEDIKYLKNQLSMDLTDLEANNKFLEEIQNSLNSTFRRIDNLFHAMKRG